MRKILLASLLLILPLISSAQYQVGIRGGFTLYWFTQPSDRFQYNYNYSHDAYSLAVSLEERSSHTFNLAYKLKYSYRSFEIQSNELGLGGGGSVDYRYKLGNLSLHILPQFVFGSRFRFFFYPGIYFETLLHSSLQGTTFSWVLGQTGRSDTISGNARGYYPKFVFGVLMGWGFEIPLKPNLCLTLENNTTINLTPVATAWGSEGIKMININFEAGVAWRFYNVKTKTKEKAN